MGNRVGRDVFMYSSTIDSDRGTPALLKKYSENFQVGPGRVFLTGQEEDITLLRQKLGLYIDEIQADGSQDHNLSLIIGNQATGQWMKRSPFENPYFLATQIGSWLSNWKLPDRNQESYEDAPELRSPSLGETLYCTRCAACHTIGGGDVFELKDKRVGPDRLRVTQKRERKWLARWLAEPEKILAEKDPIIMGLYEKYNNVAMPNMRLNDLEVDSLIDYMDTESRRIEKAKKDPAVASAPSCCDLPKSIENGSSTTSVIICALGLAILLLVAVYKPFPKRSHNLENQFQGNNHWRTQ